MDATDSTSMKSLLAHTLELKAQQRHHLANLPILEKLRVLESLRDRAILLREARRLMISPRIQALADKYGVKVRRDTVNCSPNTGCFCMDIALGAFDDPDIELVAFFHELGHFLSPPVIKRGNFMCRWSQEGLAWELGLAAAFEEGYEWKYQSKEMIWARAQLKTYVIEPN